MEKKTNLGMIICIVAIIFSLTSIILSGISLTQKKDKVEHFNVTTLNTEEENKEENKEEPKENQAQENQETPAQDTQEKEEQTTTIIVNEAPYDIKLDLTTCESIYVIPSSGSGVYAKELYIKNNTVWYTTLDDQTYYRLLSACIISVVYKNVEGV